MGSEPLLQRAVLLLAELVGACLFYGLLASSGVCSSRQCGRGVVLEFSCQLRAGSQSGRVFWTLNSEASEFCSACIGGWAMPVQYMC